MDISKLRQELREEISSVNEIISPAFERGDIVPGYVYIQKLRCGKEGCHCAKAELHKRMALGISRFGINSARYIKKEDVENLRKQTESYKKVREARRQFRSWFKRVVRLLDDLERGRTIALTEFGFSVPEGSKKKGEKR